MDLGPEDNDWLADLALRLRDFAADHSMLVIKGGLLAGEVLSPERVSELAELEPRDVLLAKLAWAFGAPLTAMAGLMAAMPRDFASMLGQLIDRLPEEPLGAEEAPAEEAPAEEAPAKGASAEDEAPGEEEAAAEETPSEEAPAEQAVADESGGDEPDADAPEADAGATGEATAPEASDASEDDTGDQTADEAEEE